MSTTNSIPHDLRRSALRFVLLMGLVSLLADVTYEGARSLAGPYLQLLGASAAVVAATAGLGELVGYALRLVSGWLTDRTGRHWLIAIIGYAVNLLAVPMLAWAGRWEIAVMLLILERLGKAVRAPARDVMLSHATKNLGTGWGFGIHSCVGRTLAQLEADAFFGALIEKVARFAAAGEPEWWMTTIGHGPAKLPIRFYAAKQ